MFSQACVILFTGGCLPQCMLGYHTPLEQTPPPRADTPPGSRHPPGADTPPWSRHPPRSRHPPPGADNPTPPPPPSPRQSMLGDTVNARAVRILLECNLVSYALKSMRNLAPWSSEVCQLQSNSIGNAADQNYIAINVSFSSYNATAI